MTRAPRDKVILPGQPDSRWEYADFLWRVLASLIDTPIVLGLIGALETVVYGLYRFVSGFPSLHDQYPLVVVAFIALAFVALVVPPWLYFGCLESSRWGASIGKKFCGMIVVNSDGSPLTFLDASCRIFINMFRLEPRELDVDLMLLTSGKQDLADMVSETIVLRRETPPGLQNDVNRRLLVAFLTLLVLGTWCAFKSTRPYPPLKDGDLVFQTLLDTQSRAVMLATHSLYAHMGVVKIERTGPMVIEAIGPVEENDFKEWARRGVLGEVAIFRDPDLSQAEAQRVIEAADKLIGRPYNIYFSFNNDAIYCSELAYLAYKGAGLTVGTVEKVSNLHVTGGLVKKLIEQRWQTDPDCEGLTFDACYKKILDQDIITPVSIAHDKRFVEIYSSYPF